MKGDLLEPEETPLVKNARIAIVDGVEIHGCGECTAHNYSRVAIPLLPPTHYCNSVVDELANDMIIFNPNDIPDSCPFLINERKPVHVFVDPTEIADDDSSVAFEVMWIIRSVGIMVLLVTGVAMFLVVMTNGQVTVADAITLFITAILLGIVTSPVIKWLGVRFRRRLT